MVVVNQNCINIMLKVLCVFGCAILLCLHHIQTVAASTCPGNQITWIDKNNTFIRCSPCPPCPPGQEFTIACRTKVLEGTLASCINCPRGKYSRLFDTKPCVHCQICSKRYTRRTCTSFRNAKCGDCLPGYYKSDAVVRDCIECDKCCGDGKDFAPPGCKKVGMCKPRSSGCPPKPSVPSKPSKRLTGWMERANYKGKTTLTPQRSTKIKLQPLTKRTPPVRAPAKITLNQSFLTRKNRLKPTPTPPQEHMNTPSTVVADVDDKKGYQISIIILSVVCLGLVFAVGYFINIKKKEQRTHSHTNRGFYRSASYCSTPVHFQPAPSENDRLLTDFVENGHQKFDDVCVQLNRHREGRYDFEKIALRLSLSQTERQGLLNNANQNPTKELFEILRCSNPTLTVKQFAKIVKDIKRADVYRMLEPFFENN